VRKKLWLLLFLAEIGIFGTTFWYLKQLKVGYAVVQNETALVAGPNQRYHTLGRLVKGQIVEISKNGPAWCYLEDRQIQGWCNKDDLLII